LLLDSKVFRFFIKQQTVKEVLIVNICMITPEYPPKSGGIGYYVYNLSKKLVAKNHHVTVLTRKRNSDQKVQEFKDGIYIQRVPFYPIYPFHASLLKFFINKFFKLIEFNFDIVHIHSPMPLPVKTCLPIITTVHTPMRIDAKYHEVFDFKSLFEKVQSTLLYPPMESELFELSKKITTVSRTVALELREYGLDSSEISIVENGVDTNSFFPNKQKTSNKEYILYAGVLRARKGLFDLIRCADYVNKVRPNTKFVICGRGSFRKKIEKAVKKMGLEKQVIFLGHVSRNKLINTYQNATIQIIPSHYEGMPTTLLEGMSCGLPVIATDIGGNNEVITSDVNGILVPPKCPEELAKAILRLLADRSFREKIGIAARKLVEEHYNWDRISVNIQKFYEKMLDA